MNCTICGAELAAVTTDLPFKLGPNRIVILKDLPVLQCGSCPEYLIEDAVQQRLDEMLDGVDGGAELEVLRYAA